MRSCSVLSEEEINTLKLTEARNLHFERKPKKVPDILHGKQRRNWRSKVRAKVTQHLLGLGIEDDRMEEVE